MKSEKPWWYHEDSYIEEDHDGPVYNEKAIVAIVAEAERRGYERAMEEVMAEAGKWPAKGKETIFQDGNGARTVDGYFIPKSFFEKV